MAAEPLSLMEFVHALLGDAHLRGRFADSPRATLQAHGLGDLGPADVHDALDLVQDNEITDFHAAHPAWDPDAFGHGGSPAVHLAWSAVDDPAGGIRTGWAPAEDTDTASDAGWADDGYGAGHEPDPGSADDGGAGPDFHHHG